MSEENREQLEQYKQSCGQVNFKDNEIITSIGQPTDKQTTLTMSFSEKTYRTNLIREVKKRGLIQEKLDPQAAARSFFYPIPFSAIPLLVATTPVVPRKGHEQERVSPAFCIFFLRLLQCADSTK